MKLSTRQGACSVISIQQQPLQIFTSFSATGVHFVFQIGTLLLIARCYMGETLSTRRPIPQETTEYKIAQTYTANRCSRLRLVI